MPSAVVSPLTPAFVTVHGRLFVEIRAASTAGKLSPIDGVTARLSPRTTTRRSVSDAADGADGFEPHAATRQSGSTQASARWRSFDSTVVIHIRMRECRPQAPGCRGIFFVHLCDITVQGT
jgi:hypothetical protein